MMGLSTNLWSASISSSQARSAAQKFLASKGLSGALQQTAATPARSRGDSATDYFYVFNVGRQQGYVIVSADDRTPAVLGYSEHGSFDADRMPSNMAAWLDGYARQIQYIQAHDLPVAPRRATNPAVADMIQTHWNQDAPYNDQCPEWGGTRCVTGCTTTALAQVMYYHQTPSGQCGAIPSYTTSARGIACEALPATTFDWGSMDAYSSTPEARTAVATLMKYCGYALQADFDAHGSTVWDNMIVPALQDYFGYGSGVQLVQRDSYTADNWDMLIYTELAAGRPVIYSGQADSGGHTFIVHGYDGAGYYSVNWGWGGSQDGKYLLSAMMPTGGGIGSGDTTGNGYNSGQTAIVHLARRCHPLSGH